MRLTIAAAGLMLTASMAFAGEATSTNVASPEVAAVATTGQSGAEGAAALSPAPYKAKAKSADGGCHGSRQAIAPLLMY